MRDKTVGEHQPYIGIIKKKRHTNEKIMTCLFTDQAQVPLPAVVQSIARKVDYSYLKPSMIIIVVCTKNELIKFGDECAKKSLANNWDKRLVWASLRSVID